MAEKTLEQAQRFFFIALGIDMAVTAVSVASDFWVIDVLKTIGVSGLPASESAIDNIELWRKFSMLMILTSCWVGWTLTRWIVACYAHAKEVLHATGFSQEKWIVTGWIVPFLNLFKPYQVLSEIYRAGTAGFAQSDEWKKTSGSGWLLTWWFFWSISHLVMVAALKARVRNPASDTPTLSQIIGSYNDAMLFCALSLVIAGLWFVVAGNLTKRLLKRSDQPFKQVALAKNATHSAPASNDAYAAALAEIEENRIDKGTWARCYALSDGDESKAKAAYIKARAGVLGAAPTWANTQPNSLDGAGVDIASTTSNTDGGSQSSTNPFPKWLVQSAIGLVLFGVLLAIALPAYQDSAKRKAVAATPVQAPAPPETPGNFGANDKIVPPAPQVDWDKGVIAPPPAAQSEAVTTKNGAYGEKDERALNPNGDKGTLTPTPATNSFGLPSNRPSWGPRAIDLKARAERGEIASVDGLTSRTAPVYGDEWSENDTLVLENSQTWWTSSQINVGSVFMHLQNQSAKGLSGAALEYKGRPCNENASVNTTYLTLVTSIPPGGQAVVNFRTDFPIETKGVSCLVIKRAWK